MRRKLQDNLKRVRHRIEEACVRAGRPPKRVTLVVVTKYVSLDVIRQLVELGVSDLGESRPQELSRRAAATAEWLSRQARHPSSPLSPNASPAWHQVGHLQRNKVKLVLPWAKIIHSVDTLRLAEEIDEQSGRAGRVTPVMIEVNAGNEPTKHGVPVAAALHLAELVATLKNIRLCGLMTMAPLTDDEARLRTVFQRMRELFDEAREGGVGGADFTSLSMGMTNDFEYAIEAGATHVRIGSAIFEGIDQPVAV